MTIPRNLYLYWGNETISFLRAISICSFAHFNSDWKVILIRNNNLDERRSWRTGEKSDKDYYQGGDYSSLFKNYSNIQLERFDLSWIYEINPQMADVHVKDILNWFLLAERGGFVVDTDVLFFSSFSRHFRLLKKSDIVLTFFERYPALDYIPVTFMGSSPDNSFFYSILETAKKSYNSAQYQCCGSSCIRPRTKRDIELSFPGKRVYNLGNIIYPFVSTEPWHRGLEKIHVGNYADEIPEGIIGIHWYGGSKKAIDSNSRINGENYLQIQNTLTSKIKDFYRA